MKNGVVIVGAGHAGVQAAASLREEGYDGPVIAGRRRERTALPQAAAVQDLHQGRRGEAADRCAPRPSIPARHRLSARVSRRPHRCRQPEAGDRRWRRLAFDRLILATGSRPRSLSLPGSDARGRAVAALARRRAAIRDLSAQSDGCRHPRRRLHRAGDRRDARGRRPPRHRGRSAGPAARPGGGAGHREPCRGNGWRDGRAASSPGPRSRGSKAKTAVFRLR